MGEAAAELVPLSLANNSGSSGVPMDTKHTG